MHFRSPQTICICVFLKVAFFSQPCFNTTAVFELKCNFDFHFLCMGLPKNATKRTKSPGVTGYFWESKRPRRKGSKKKTWPNGPPKSIRFLLAACSLFVTSNRKCSQKSNKCIGSCRFVGPKADITFNNEIQYISKKKRVPETQKVENLMH